MFGKQTPGHAAEVRRWMGAAKRGLVTKAGKSAAKDTGEGEATQDLCSWKAPLPLGQKGRGEEKVFPDGG